MMDEGNRGQGKGEGGEEGAEEGKERERRKKSKRRMKGVMEALVEGVSVAEGVEGVGRKKRRGKSSEDEDGNKSEGEGMESRSVKPKKKEKKEKKEKKKREGLKNSSKSKTRDEEPDEETHTVAKKKSKKGKKSMQRVTEVEEEETLGKEAEVEGEGRKARKRKAREEDDNEIEGETVSNGSKSRKKTKKSNSLHDGSDEIMTVKPKRRRRQREMQEEEETLLLDKEVYEEEDWALDEEEAEEDPVKRYDLLGMIFIHLNSLPSIENLTLRTVRRFLELQLGVQEDGLRHLKSEIRVILEEYRLVLRNKKEREKEKDDRKGNLLRYSSREGRIIMGYTKYCMKENKLKVADLCCYFRTNRIRGVKRKRVILLFDSLTEMFPYRKRSTIRHFVENFLSRDVLTGQWTEDDWEQLMVLQELHGLNYKLIGLALGKRRVDIKDALIRGRGLKKVLLSFIRAQL